MARNADTLAGLAALAGAAYLYNNQKNKDAGKAAIAGVDSNPTRGSGRDSTETRLKTPSESIAEADKSDKSTSISTKGGADTTTPGTDNSEPDNKKSDATSVTNVKNANTTPAKPVVKRQDRTTMYGTKSGVMGGATLPYASASPDPVKRSREEAQAVIDQHKIDAAAERKKRLALQLGAKPYTPVKPSKLPVETAPEGLETLRRGSNTDALAISDPERAKRFNPRSMADQMRAKRDADNAKKIADMQRKTESFANPQPDMEDQIRQNMNSAGMKRGGSVKMASGGMAASRRGDGIAQRGKTRGKMC